MRMADYHKDNASFMLYKNWKVLFDSLTDEEAGQLIKALFCFACGEDVPEQERLVAGMLLIMSQQLERDGVKWEKKCERNAENIRKRWNKSNTDKANGNESNTTEYERIPNDTTVKGGTQSNTNYTDKDKDKDKDKEKISPNAEAFEKVWAQYPKREGRKDALAAFEKAIKKGTTVEQIENGIQAYCEHIKKCNIDRQFIKQGSTYFRGEHWNDVYDDSSAATAEPKKKTSYDLSKVIPAIPVNR